MYKVVYKGCGKCKNVLYFLIGKGNARFLRSSPLLRYKAVLVLNTYGRLYFLTLSIIKIGKGCENENGKIDCQRNNFVNLHSSKPPKIKFQHMADRVRETPP